MTVTITLGKAGRLVVPKAIRDSLGLHEGSRLKLEVQGGKLQAAPEPDPVNIGMKGGFPVIQGGPPLKWLSARIPLWIPSSPSPFHPKSRLGRFAIPSNSVRRGPHF